MRLVYDTTKRSIFTQWQITGKVPIKQGLWIVTTTQVVLPFQPACPPSQSKYFPESRNWESASLNASLRYWQAVLSQLNHIIPASGLPCLRLALGFVSCFLLFLSADSQPSLPACCYLTLTFPRLQSSAAFLSHPPAFLRLPYLFPVLLTFHLSDEMSEVYVSMNSLSMQPQFQSTAPCELRVLTSAVIRSRVAFLLIPFWQGVSSYQVSSNQIPELHTMEVCSWRLLSFILKLVQHYMEMLKAVFCLISCSPLVPQPLST